MTSAKQMSGENMGTRRIRWGILGTSFISEVMAQAINETETAELVAVASRTQERAREFAQKFNIGNYYGDYLKLLQDSSVEAVYIGLPNHLHKDWIVYAAQASKHILCEKTLVLTAAEATEVMEAVRAAGVLCMEALMYLHHPFIKAIKNIVDSQELGAVRHINAFYSAPIAHVANTTAGGAIRNLGCYPISLIQFLLGLKLQSSWGVIKDNDFEFARQANISLQYPGNISALVATADDMEMAWQFDIFTNQAHLHVESNPWLPDQHNNLAVIKKMAGKEISYIKTKAEKPLYCYQIDSLSRAVLSARPSTELISLEQSLATIEILEAWQKN